MTCRVDQDNYPAQGEPTVLPAVSAGKPGPAGGGNRLAGWNMNSKTVPEVLSEDEPKRRILVIAGDPGARNELAELLSHWTSEVYLIAAFSPASGSELAVSFQPDVIVIDGRNPDAGGWKLARDLKEDPQTRSIPIIQITPPFPLGLPPSSEPSADILCAPPLHPMLLIHQVKFVFRLVEAEKRMRSSQAGLQMVVNKRMQENQQAKVLQRLEIDDVQKTRKALRTSEGRYCTLFNALFDPMFVCRQNPAGKLGTILEVNDAACKTLGFTREALLKQSFLDVVNPRHRGQVMEHLKQIAKGTAVTFPSECLTHGDVVMKVEVHFRNMSFRGFTAVLAIVKDFSLRLQWEKERLDLQKQILQAGKMECIGRLAAGIAHDFNNMLGVILGNVELLGIEENSPAELKASLREIAKAAEHSTEITQQLLGFLRHRSYDPKPISVNNCIQRAKNTLMTLMGEDVRLSFVLATDPWPIIGDLGQIEQILFNLVANARDAMPKGGTLHISTKNWGSRGDSLAAPPDLPAGEFVLLQVEDNGQGMTEETRTHIFEPLFTTKLEGEGTGLGLANVHSIVKLHRGHIVVVSAPGMGTCFRVFFPRCAESLGKTMVAQSSSGEIPPGTVVLLVEDDALVRRQLKCLLEKLKCKVFESKDPLEALKIAQTEGKKLELLLTDVVMPEMGGKELQRRIQRIVPGIRVLYMSGYAGKIINNQGIADDEAFLLHKPLRRKTLTKKIREILGADPQGNPRA